MYYIFFPLGLVGNEILSVLRQLQELFGLLLSRISFPSLLASSLTHTQISVQSQDPSADLWTSLLLREHTLWCLAQRFLAQIGDTARLLWSHLFAAAWKWLPENKLGQLWHSFASFVSWFSTTFSAISENYYFIYCVKFSSCFGHKGKSHPYYSRPRSRGPTNINLKASVTFHAAMHRNLLNHYLTVVYLGYFHFSSYKDMMNIFVHKA